MSRWIQRRKADADGYKQHGFIVEGGTHDYPHVRWCPKHKPPYKGYRCGMNWISEVPTTPTPAYELERIS